MGHGLDWEEAFPSGLVGGLSTYLPTYGVIRLGAYSLPYIAGRMPSGSAGKAWHAWERGSQPLALFLPLYAVQRPLGRRHSEAF